MIEQYLVYFLPWLAAWSILLLTLSTVVFAIVAGAWIANKLLPKWYIRGELRVTPAHELAIVVASVIVAFVFVGPLLIVLIQNYVVFQ